MDLRDQIERICLDFPRYGYRRVTKQLQRERWIVNHKRVLRVMRENDLLCRIRKRRVRTTDANHSYPVFPNLIKDSVITSINQVFCFWYHLHSDSNRLCLSCHHSGPLLPQSYRVCSIRTYRYKTNPFCFADGHKGQKRELQAAFTILIEAFNTPHLSMSMSWKNMVFKSVCLEQAIPMTMLPAKAP